jgi:uncharacterized damage-inducible protein DinB
MSDQAREALIHSLTWLRESVIEQCELLSDEQARTHLVESKTTPLGIVRHLIAVEHYWFRFILTGGEMSEDWIDGGDDDPEWEVDGLSVHAMTAIYRDVIKECNSLIGNVDLDAQSKNLRDGHHVTLAWILLHMIEETARHLGHMDILVEQLIAQ